MLFLNSSEKYFFSIQELISSIKNNPVLHSRTRKFEDARNLRNPFCTVTSLTTKTPSSAIKPRIPPHTYAPLLFFNPRRSHLNHPTPQKLSPTQKPPRIPPYSSSSTSPKPTLFPVHRGQTQKHPRLPRETALHQTHTDTRRDSRA